MRRFVILASIVIGAHSLACAQDAASVQSGNQKVEMIIENKSNLALTVQWLDFDGKPQDYGVVPAGQSLPYETYPGHNWRFVVNQKAVGSYRATAADRQTFTLSGGSSAPVPATSPSQGGAVKPQMKGNGNGLFEQFRRLKEEGMNRNNSGSNLPGRTPVQNKPVVPTAGSGAGSQVNAGNAKGTGSAMDSAEAKQLLDYHNQVRAEVGVGKVSWSPQLAIYAQEWADHLAKAGKFEHRPSSQKQYGENLAAGSHPGYNGLSGAQGWYGEKSLYKRGAPFSMKFMNAGHYTQMVWRSSTQIGAGKAVCTKGKYKGWTIIVCNYNPGGNMLGQPAY